MQPEILEYVARQRVGVLAVEMLDGSPHGATVHFAHSENPLRFIFLTSPESRKMGKLHKNGFARTSFVIGVSEADLRTLQLDGEARPTKDQETTEIYFRKFPEKKQKHPDDIIFTFIPTWWRFTDWTRPEGKTIFLSDGTVTVAKRSK